MKDLMTQEIYLVLTGWILPTDTSLNIQIDQNPSLAPLEFPSVWVPDSEADSGWKKAIEYMGFPGGKTKTIVVDVTNVLNQEDPRGFEFAHRLRSIGIARKLLCRTSRLSFERKVLIC